MIREYKCKIFSLVATLIFFGCSTANKEINTSAENGVTANTDAAATDAVGSIPEDTEASKAIAEELSAVEEGSGEDPFANLETAKEIEAASATTENLATETVTALDETPPAVATEETFAPVVAEPEMKAEMSSSEHKMYTVHKGDTLMKIAFSIYGDIDRWKDLLAWNKDQLTIGSKVEVGTRLKYEAPLDAFSLPNLDHSYLIEKGDTLSLIAKGIYGKISKWKKLQEYNAKLIKDPNIIFAGFTLFYEITREEMAEAESIKRAAASVPQEQQAVTN